MMRRRALAVILMAAVGVAVSVAISARPVSGAGQQTRDALSAREGTGVIAGTLVAADTNLALREARVTLTRAEEDLAPLVTLTGVTLTDDRGAFTFSQLPAGRYALSAQKTGFVPGAYGQKRPLSSRPTTLELAAGQRLERLTFALVRTAVVTGTVFDDFGEPAMGARVAANRWVTVGGRRLLIGAGLAEADDRGTYRLHSLVPGEYVIAVNFGALPTMSEAYQAGAATRLASIGAGAAVQGLITRLGPPPPAEPGAMRYVPTFYPASPSVASATSIVLAPGEVRPGIDIRLQRVPLTRVSGLVRDLDGSAPPGEARLIEVGGAVNAQDVEMPFASKTLDSEGRFAFTGIAPGQYTLMVRKRIAPGGESSEIRWAMQDLTVSGGPVDLALTLQSPLAVSGTLASNSGGLPDPLPNVVRFTPLGSTRFVADPAGQQVASINANGRFAAENLMPGRYAVSVIPESADWRLVSAMFGGRDALDFMLEVKPGDTLQGALLFSRNGTELSGTLTDSAGKPARCCTVVVFAADANYWVPGNRRNTAVDPDANGRFVFSDLPPGTYRLAAVEDYDAIAGPDATLLRQLVAASVLVTLADGERKTQHLRTR